jgi:hypothetical protein
MKKKPDYWPLYSKQMGRLRIDNVDFATIDVTARHSVEPHLASSSFSARLEVRNQITMRRFLCHVLLIR